MSKGEQQSRQRRFAGSRGTWRICWRRLPAMLRTTGKRRNISILDGLLALSSTAVVAQFGQVHPEVAYVRKLRQDVFLAEIDLEQLYKAGLRTVSLSLSRNIRRWSGISRFCLRMRLRSSKWSRR